MKVKSKIQIIWCILILTILLFQAACNLTHDQKKKAQGIWVIDSVKIGGTSYHPLAYFSVNLLIVMKNGKAKLPRFFSQTKVNKIYISPYEEDVNWDMFLTDEQYFIEFQANDSGLEGTFLFQHSVNSQISNLMLSKGDTTLFMTKM